MWAYKVQRGGKKAKKYCHRYWEYFKQQEVFNFVKNVYLINYMEINDDPF